MATLPEPFSSKPDNQYAALLEVSQAIAAHQSLNELFQDLGRRLHSVLIHRHLTKKFLPQMKNTLLPK